MWQNRRKLVNVHPTVLAALGRSEGGGHVQGDG